MLTTSELAGLLHCSPKRVLYLAAVARLPLVRRRWTNAQAAALLVLYVVVPPARDAACLARVVVDWWERGADGGLLVRCGAERWGYSPGGVSLDRAVTRVLPLAAVRLRLAQHARAD